MDDPITREGFLQSVEAPLSGDALEYIITRIKARKVSFTLDSQDETTIRQVQKRLDKKHLDVLFETIRENYKPDKHTPLEATPSPVEQGEPKITGKVMEERGFLFADNTNGYLYIVVHVHLKNEGASTAIQDYRATYSFFKEVIEAKSDRCSQFRMVKTPEGTAEVSELNDLREDKTPFRKYYPRDGWLCFKALIGIRLIDTDEYYPHMKDLSIEVIDGNDGVHRLDVYPQFAGGGIRLQMGRSLRRIQPR